MIDPTCSLIGMLYTNLTRYCLKCFHLCQKRSKIANPQCAHYQDWTVEVLIQLAVLCMLLIEAIHTMFTSSVSVCAL